MRTAFSSLVLSVFLAVGAHAGDVQNLKPTLLVLPNPAGYQVVPELPTQVTERFLREVYTSSIYRKDLETALGEELPIERKMTSHHVEQVPQCRVKMRSIQGQVTLYLDDAQWLRTQSFFCRVARIFGGCQIESVAAATRDALEAFRLDVRSPDGKDAPVVTDSEGVEPLDADACVKRAQGIAPRDQGLVACALFPRHSVSPEPCTAFLKNSTNAMQRAGATVWKAHWPVAQTEVETEILPPLAKTRSRVETLRLARVWLCYADRPEACTALDYFPFADLFQQRETGRELLTHAAHEGEIPRLRAWGVWKNIDEKSPFPPHQIEFNERVPHRLHPLWGAESMEQP